MKKRCYFFLVFLFFYIILFLMNCSIPNAGSGSSSSNKKSKKKQTITYSDIVYVNIDATGKNDGTSWENAFTDPQSAIDFAYNNNIPEVWVAEGVYKPSQYPNGGDEMDPKARHFSLENNVAVYGGFSGIEDERSQRDPSNYKTVFSGDLDDNDEVDVYGNIDNNLENIYHVFYHKFNNSSNNLNQTAILDGAWIVGGYDELTDCGGGMVNYESSPRIINCTFYANESGYNGYGAGMYNEHNSSPVLTSCLFLNNIISTGYGAGMANMDNSSPEIKNCTFDKNKAYGRDGGGIYNYSSSPVIFNCKFINNYSGEGAGIANFENANPTINDCLFYNNIAGTYGAGVINDRSSPIIKYCIFTENKANTNGGGIVDRESSYILTNCIFYKNISDSYGGAMSNYNSNIKIINCIYFGNTSNEGNSIYNNQTSPIITNCIFWGNGSEIINNNANSVVSYSIIQGGYAGGANIISNDPFFLNTNDPDGADNVWGTSDDGLIPGSTAINKGNKNIVTEEYDIKGDIRIQGVNVDIGAYEVE